MKERGRERGDIVFPHFFPYGIRDKREIGYFKVKGGGKGVKNRLLIFFPCLRLEKRGD